MYKTPPIAFNVTPPTARKVKWTPPKVKNPMMVVITPLITPTKLKGATIIILDILVLDFTRLNTLLRSDEIFITFLDTYYVFHEWTVQVLIVKRY